MPALQRFRAASSAGDFQQQAGPSHNGNSRFSCRAELRSSGRDRLSASLLFTGTELRDRHAGHVGGSADDAGSVDALDDVIVGLPVLDRGVHVRGRRQGQYCGIQLLIGSAAAG